jgi:hypothetical protein
MNKWTKLAYQLGARPKPKGLETTPEGVFTVWFIDSAGISSAKATKHHEDDIRYFHNVTHVRAFDLEYFYLTKEEAEQEQLHNLYGDEEELAQQLENPEELQWLALEQLAQHGGKLEKQFDYVCTIGEYRELGNTPAEAVFNTLLEVYK